MESSLQPAEQSSGPVLGADGPGYGLMGHGIADTEAGRRDGREMLFATEGVGEFISGAIRFDEAILPRSRNGMLFPGILSVAPPRNRPSARRGTPTSRHG